MKFPSKELLSEVFGREVSEIKNTCTDKEIVIIAYFDGFRQAFTMNIYELAHKNLKQWAKVNNVFNEIDWSEEPERIFKKAEELRNEIN